VTESPGSGPSTSAVHATISAAAVPVLTEAGPRAAAPSLSSSLVKADAAGRKVTLQDPAQSWQELPAVGKPDWAGGEMVPRCYVPAEPGCRGQSLVLIMACTNVHSP
jgi:hypothetical protein